MLLIAVLIRFKLGINLIATMVNKDTILNIWYRALARHQINDDRQHHEADNDQFNE